MELYRPANRDALFAHKRCYSPNDIHNMMRNFGLFGIRVLINRSYWGYLLVVLQSKKRLNFLV